LELSRLEQVALRQSSLESARASRARVRAAIQVNAEVAPTNSAKSGKFSTNSLMRASNLTLPTTPTLRPKLRVLREQFVIQHRRLLAIVRDDDVCRRLMTVPGVGPVVSLTYRATVDVPARFRKSKAVGAVFGLTCAKYQSGEVEWTGSPARPQRLRLMPRSRYTPLRKGGGPNGIDYRFSRSRRLNSDGSLGLT
jgi:hypothetical protein